MAQKFKIPLCTAVDVALAAATILSLVNVVVNEKGGVCDE